MRFVNFVILTIMKELPIYLDNNSTTPIDERVLEAMMPYLTSKFGNASSSHLFGVSVNKSVNEARVKVAEMIDCSENDIIFTSGATEAINLAIKGLIFNANTQRKHIVISSTEHPAVLDTCQFLQRQGYEINRLPVNPNGLLDLELLKGTVKSDTALVCIMLVNNETGIIQPIKEISEIAHSNGALFMTDATQGVGKIPISVNKMGIDLMSFSAHKFYGPKGVGALYMRRKRPNKVRLESQIHGGGHENGFRSGTLNVPGIIGIGAAAEIALKEFELNSVKIRKLRDKLEHTFLQNPYNKLNGDAVSRIFSTSNICFEGVDADAIMVGLKNIAVSNGSACSSFSVEPSHVLKAMSRTDAQAFSSIRFSLSRYNTMEEIEQTIKQVTKVVNQLRQMSNREYLI